MNREIIRKIDRMRLNGSTPTAMAKELGISISHSYKIMQQLNKELKAKGYMTIAGRVNRKYFMEKFCYNGTERK